ncbi:ribonuclease H-like protein [Dentipellis sp. KUC8613]|nr:ribonuclease H-like protein [Dentipellis sp. KUC8613]
MPAFREYVHSDDDIDDDDDGNLSTGAAGPGASILPSGIGGAPGEKSHVPNPSMYVQFRRLTSRRPRPSSGPITQPQRLFLPPTPYTPPTSLFRPLATSQVHHPRYVAYGHRNMVLVYSGGSCLDNGTRQARAGCAFIYHPIDPSANPTFRLENLPTEKGLYTRQTNNRAELRAAIAALDCMTWNRDGFTCIVIASDSQYLVAGITRHVWRWRENGWTTSRGSPVCNQDLWVRLLDTVENWEKCGVQPMFWRIPQEWTASVTDRARNAAGFQDVRGWVHISAQ